MNNKCIKATLLLSSTFRCTLQCNKIIPLYTTQPESTGNKHSVQKQRVLQKKPVTPLVQEV